MIIPVATTVDKLANYGAAFHQCRVDHGVFDTAEHALEYLRTATVLDPSLLFGPQAVRYRPGTIGYDRAIVTRGHRGFVSISVHSDGTPSDMQMSVDMDDDYLAALMQLHDFDQEYLADLLARVVCAGFQVTAILVHLDALCDEVARQRPTKNHWFPDTLDQLYHVIDPGLRVAEERMFLNRFLMS